MTTPFDQQPQPVPPSEGTNDAPEDRANNAPTVPNAVPAGQPNVASDGATTTPMTPATAPQQPAGAPFDRVYAVSPQQLFQVIHDQLTTGATFTLDNENTQTGAFFLPLLRWGELHANRSPAGCGWDRHSSGGDWKRKRQAR